ncbi:MAG: peptidylprolyl isomerase [Candidatus Palauibacterales bacterium]|nr:peptidylprolyl isomerase [Candidatus Palauibacterales bacterium]MDP2528832.1 peptidylprolyl isomerase [Candidatus Palauibacterales bacterium]
MSEAKTGDTVTVQYTGTLDDGTVFDSSEDREPLTFTIGAGDLIPGFEQAVVGMEPGQSLTATFGPEAAYGERSDDLVFRIGRDQLPEEVEPEVGDRLEARDPEGNKFGVSVAAVAEDVVTLDANHPLAGRDLTFEIELVAID